MSRDAAWLRRVGQHSAALACIVGVSGAWLLLPRLTEGGAGVPRALPAAPVVGAALAPAERGRAARSTPPTAAASRAKPELAALQHPLSAEHRALYRDVDLLDAGWRALEAHDFARARAVLARHRAESARTYDDLNDGLTILADCMQYATAEARARARRFYDEQTFSMARRRIRRYCLEGEVPTTAR